MEASEAAFAAFEASPQGRNPLAQNDPLARIEVDHAILAFDLTFGLAISRQQLVARLPHQR